MAATKLDKYQSMRDFGQTAEPSGHDAKVVPSEALRFATPTPAPSHLQLAPPPALALAAVLYRSDKRRATV